MKGAVGVAGAALWLAVAAHAASPTFPFVYKYDDGTASVTNLSSLLHAPAGLYGFVTVDGSGHLATSAGRQKFFGTNLTYQSNFPSAADAAKVAARMAKFGINLVRFHHMDYTTAPAGIWSSVSPDRVLDPAQLDKLDRFIFELKQKGIYSNINLAVSRPYNYGPTLHTDINLVTDGKLRQALAFFDPALLQLHKDYATDLLTHVNPYTGKAYTNEPALAFIEISNEVGLIGQWLGCALDGLPPFYKNELNTQWNDWLTAKYTNFAGLKAAGFGYDQPLGSEMLVNPNFTSGTANWGLDVSGGAAASWAVTMEGPTSNESAKVQITTPGSAAWNVSLFQGNLNVSTLTPYTVTFWAKASSNRTIAVAVNMNHAPWSGLGFYRQINLTTTWQSFTLGFDLTASDTNARLMFTDLAIPAGTVWISQVSMKPGGLVGLYAGEDLDTDSMLNFTCNEATPRTTVGRRDWITFLWELEDAYWTGMRDHLKTTLGAKALIMGTAQSFSSANLMAKLDVVDTHAYWEHPAFPSVAWSPTDWYLNNTPMTNNQSNSLGWANMKRVVGKPWSISEYNHPRPLVFDGEMAFFMAGYGAFQDYDAVYEFDYESWTPSFDGQAARTFFQMNQNPVKMATCLPAAAAFLRGDIAPATGRIVAALSQATEIDLVRSGGYIPDLAWLGENSKASFVHGVAIATEGVSVPGGSIAPGTTPLPNVLTSDTGELVWDLSVAGQGFVTLDTARSKWAWGTIGTRTVNFGGGITVAPGTTMASNLGGVALTALDGLAPMLTARKIILTAVGAQTNTGQNYYQYPSTVVAFPPPLNIQLTSKNEWGGAPSIVEGVPATVTLPFPPSNVRVWSLTTSGARVASLTVNNAAGKAQFAIDSTFTALQYEIEVDHAKLEASLAAWPNVNTGSNFRVTLTITNTGTAAATGVALLAPFVLNGSATVNPVGGPSPAMPYATIAAGASVTFTWTYNGAAPGTKTFTVSVTGTDSISGAAVSAGPVASNPVTIIDPVALLPSIKVNHFGWRPNDQKSAIVNTNPGASAVLHRAGDGSIAYTIPADGGSITSKGLDPNGNENVWQIDFSNFKTEGSYYLKVPSLSGNSDVFEIRENVYNRVGYAMLKSFYAQRCGTAHPAAYMGAGWADAGVCHAGDTAVDWNNTDDPGGVSYGNNLDLSGGWHDAGDYNKYIGGLDVIGPASWGGDNGAGVWGIAMGFEMNTTAFKSDGTGIPESGNGIPDALDEMRYEIDWFRKMQAGAGGSAVLSMCHAKAGDFGGGSPPSTDTTVRYYTGPTLESTAAAGACFALGARLFAPYDATYAAILTTAANNAWTGIPAGDDDAKFWFACELYRLNPAGPNGAAAKAYVEGYFNYAQNWGMGSMYVNYGALPARGNSQTAIRGLMAYTLATGGTASVITSMRSQFSQFVTTCFAQAGGYGSGLQDADYNWGSNAYVGSRATSLLHAARIGATGAKTPAEVRTQAQQYLHYLFGLNGPNMVYVSNVAALGGEHSSYQFYHGWFGNWNDVDGKAAFVGKPAAIVEAAWPYFAGVDSEGISDTNTSTWGPFPGFVPGGANKRYGVDYGIVTPPAGASGNHYFYRDWVFCCSGFDSSGSQAQPWTITENSLGYNGPCMAMVAAFMTPETLLTLSKTASGNPVNMDQALTYTIVATSAGGGTAYSVSVWDTVPAGVTFGWASPGGVFDGTKVVWTLPNLAPGASVAVSFTVTVTSPGPVIGPNVASGDYRDALAVQQPTVTTLPVSVNVVAGAYLQASFALSVTTVIEGFGFLVSLTITNTGLATATNLFASPFAQSGDGSGAPLWGPAPVMPFSLVPGAWITLTWSFTGSDLGTVRFTATPQGIDTGLGGAVSVRATSPPVDVIALPGCPLLFNGMESFANNGSWAGAMATRSTTTAYAAAITQGGSAMHAVITSMAGWVDDWATVSGFTPAAWSGYTSLTLDIWVDPANPPFSGFSEVRLVADSPSAGKWYQYFTPTGITLSPGANRLTLPFNWGLGSLLPTDPLTNLRIIINRATPVANGIVVVDNLRLTGTMTGGALAAAGARTPTSGIGNWATVTLTVTNTGSAAVNGVLPSLTETIGAFRVEPITGPTPPGPVDLAPGQAQTFAWTVSASGGGLVVFTPTATGGTCAGSLVSNGVALTMTITGPANLTAGLNAFPSPRNIGQPFMVTLTITNTGGATATVYLSSTILVVSGSSSSTVAIGPLPSIFPVVLAAGAQRTFTWTLTGAVSGTLYLTATVTGRDWLLNGWLGPFVITSNAVLIQTPAVLTVSAYAGPSPRQAGQPFTVSVTVTNSGEEAVTGISFAGPLKSGPGNAAPAGGPVPPTPFTLPGNSATTFTWNYTASAAGWVAYTVTLSGTRANAGTVATVGPRASGSVYIVTPAALSAWVAAGPLSVSVGQSILVTVTVTNTGGTPAYDLSSTPISLHSASTGEVTYAAGPTPAQSTTLAGGGAVTFTWTFTAVSPGFVIFQAGVSATDLLSGALLDTGTLLANGGVQVDIVLPAVLEGSPLTALPGLACIGEAVQLVMTITNSGAASATAIIPSTSLFIEGTGAAVLFAAPRPLTHLGPGGINAVRLTWSYTITAPGTLTFTATVTGADGNTWMPLTTGPRTSNAVTAYAPGALAAYLAGPDGGLQFTQVEVVLSVTNAGDQPVDLTGALLADTDPFFTYVSLSSGPLSAECPGFPCALAPGASAYFTWVYDVWSDFNAGDVVWSGTVWGTTCGTQPRMAWDTTAATAANLVAAARAFPVTRAVGQNILVTLTVTNTGNVPANGVTADPWIAAGGGGVTLVGGPTPAQGGSLAAGAAVTFTWTFTAAAAGTVEFTTTVRGTDSVSGQPLTVAPVVSNTVAIFAPASLAAGLALLPTPRNIGQGWLAVLTVTNSGQADARLAYRSPFVNFGTATAGAPVGPWPAWSTTVPGGAVFTYTWTYTGTTAGWIAFTTSIGGLDAVSGLPVSSGPVVSSTVVIQSPAALARQLVIFPRPNRNIGQDFFVTLTVTNTGGATASGLGTAGFLIAGPGDAAYADGPEPPMTAFDLPGGAAQVFTWTYTGSLAGLVRFSTTVTALDANTGAALAGVAVSNTILIQAPAALEAQVTLSAAALCTGQNIQVRLTVTNTGQASATLLIAEAWEQTGGGLATLVGGPSTATPYVLAGGATRTFTWTFTGSVAGPLVFSTTVTAQDVNSGAALVAGPLAAPEITVGIPGALAAHTTVQPYASIAQWFTVALTVTNTGGTDVTGLTATIYVNPGGALAPRITNPSPAGPLTLAPGASQTFVWTYSASGAGVVTFTATGVGTTCGATTLRVGDPVSATLQTAALLRAAMAMTPTTMCAGQPFVLTLTVTNSGAAAATGVDVPAVPFEVAGPGGVTIVAGPYPPLPDTIPGLTTVRYTWTLAGAAAGTAILTTTVTGLDANSGLVKTSLPATRSVSVGAAGALAASVSGPALVSAGQWFQVRLTLTNTGGAAVTGLTASAFLDPVDAAWIAGASPPTVATLAAGSTTTFVWTYSASGAGTVSFSLTAVGSTVCGVSIPVIGTGVLPVTVQTRAALDAAIAQWSDPVCVGQDYLVTLTITNTGQAAANALSLPAPPFTAGGGGDATAAAGPNPPLPGSLAGGAAVTLTWTFTGAAAGSVALTVTVTGLDANSALLLSSGPRTSPAITVNAAAALAAAAAVTPIVASSGQLLTVTLTVTNTGGADATGVTATIFAGPGAALAPDPVGPVPAGPVTLAAGAAQTFTWTVTAAGSGVVTFTATAAGSTCAALGVQGAASVSATLQSPAALAAATAVFPATPCVGQPLWITLTVTNTGEATATNVSPGSWLVTGTGVISSIMGPNPPAPASLGGGSSVTFTYTLTASSPGSVAFSTSISGLDSNSGLPLLFAPVLAGPQSVVIAGALESHVSVSPSTASVGQWTTVAITVTNTGGSDVTGLTATAFVAPGAGLVEVVGGPGGPVTLGAGAAQTFSWSFSTSGAGTAVFTLTASGATACGGLPVAVTGTGTGALLIESPARLAGSLAAFPSPRVTGQSFLLTLTVTNEGQAAATGLGAVAFLHEGTGTALELAGPEPVLGGALPGGASITFTWTFSGTAPGAVRLTTTVTGIDANSGWIVATGAVPSNDELIVAPAVLEAALTAFPATVTVGQPFLVTLTVTNSGGAGLLSVTASAFLPSGTAALNPGSGPAPAFPVSLAPGASLTFTWTESASAAGTVWFTTTAFGFDQVASAPVQTGPVASNVVTILTPATLEASLAAFPTPRTVGQTFLATLTITNTGQAAATGVTASPFMISGTGGAGPVVGPEPPLPVTLPGGAAITFTWTVGAASSGSVWLTTTVFGRDATSGASMQSSPVVSPSVLIQTPPALAVSVVASPTPRTQGQPFMVTVTVTNTGGAAATGLALEPFLPGGTGAATYAAGPNPALPPALAGGASVTFTWTYTGSAAGTVTFTTTATATDANTGFAVASGPAESNAELILPPAALDVSLVAFPDPRVVGQPFLVTLTVTNTGGTTMLDITASVFTVSGSASLAPEAGPTPAFPVTLAPGASMTFTWTESGTSAGSVWFTTTVYGTDQVSGAPVEVGPVVSNAVAMLTPGVLSADFSTYILDFPWWPICSGAASRITVTASNTGQAPVTVDAFEGFQTIGTGSFSVASGPAPAFPVTLAGGASINFTWTMNADQVGSGRLTMTLTGTQVLTGAPLASGPAVSATFQVVSHAVAVAVSHTPAIPVDGGIIRFSIHLTNTGTGQWGFMPLDLSMVLPVGYVALSSSIFPSPSGSSMGWNGAQGLTAWTGYQFNRPGETTTIFLDVLVCGGGTFGFTAYAWGTSCGPHGVTSPPDTITPGPATGAPLAIVATRLPSTPSPGGPVTYRIIATNTSLVSVHNVRIVNTLPAGLVFAGQSMTVPGGGFPAWNGATSGAMEWTSPNLWLQPGESVTVSIDATVCGTGLFTSTPWFGAEGPCGLPQVSDPANAFTVAGGPPVVVALDHEPAAPGAGGPVTYRIVATNTSAATLSGLLIADTLPAAVTFAAQRYDAGFGSLSWNGATSGALAWNLAGSFSPGQSVTVWIDGTVCGTGLISNTAWAGGASTCGMMEAASPVDAFASPGPPSLAVALGHEPAAPEPGGPVTYRIVATNASAATVSGLLLVDTLPAGVTFAGQRSETGFGFLSWNGATSGALAWNLFGSLSPGQSVTVWIDGTVCGAGLISNTAWAGGATACGPIEAGDPSDAFVMAGPPALAVSVAHAPASPVPGGPVTYRVLATNTTGATLTSLLITDTLAAGITFTGQSYEAPGPVFLSWNGATSGALAWQMFGSLSPAQSVTVWIDGTVCGTGPIPNPAWAGASIACGPLETADPSDVFTPSGPSMSVALSVVRTPASPLPGAAVTYLLIASNTGSATIADLDLTDTVPAAVAVGGSDQHPKLFGYGLGPNAFGWRLGAFDDFLPGETLTVTITGVAQCAPGEVSNTVFLIGGISCVTTTAQARDDFSLPAPGALAGSASGPAAASVGRWVTVSLTVTNTGGAPVAGVTATAFAGPGGPLLEFIAGPVPAGPLGLGAGTAQTFVWTYSASGSGPVTLTLTASGTACSGASALLAFAPVAVVLQTPARLTATLTVSSTLVCTGAPVIATLEVGNTGQTDAAGPVVAPFTVAGPGGLGAAAGPWPAAPGAIAGGTAIRFSWTLAGTVAGPAGLSATVTATDALLGTGLSTGVVAGPPMGVYDPAVLAAGGSLPAAVSTGQPFTAALTVTNTGGDAATVTGLDAGFAPGAGLVTAPGAALPALPVTLAPGAAVTFVWSFTATAAGPATLTVTATGAGLCGSLVAAATADTVVQAPAALDLSLTAAPTPRTIGQTFTVAVTVTNTGQAAANGFAIEPPWPAGAGVVTWLAGPVPAVPPTLAGGAAQTLVWTYSATALGSVDFTATATATDANAGLTVTAGPVTSNVVSILPPAALDIALVAFPGVVNVGQPFLVTLTVTNTGGSDVLDLTASAFIATLATGPEVGPLPAFPVTLPAGAAVTFTWTESGAAAGSLAFSTTLYGTDQLSGNPVAVGPVTSNAVTVQTPAALDAALVVFPSPLSIGQTFLATLTVTNTGQAAANGVDAAAFDLAGSGAVSAVAGPTPAAPVALAGGTAVTWTWTLTASAPGSVWLTTTVTGTDANDGTLLTAAPVVSSVVVIEAPAALEASLVVFPAPRTIGQTFEVHLTVTNTGQAAAGPLTVPAFVLSGTGGVTWLSGPVPALPYASLAGGAAVTFVWTYSATASGAVSFTATVNGFDVNSGAAIATGPVTTPAPQSIQTPATLAATLAGLPATLSAGQSVVVTLTITNSGEAAAAGVDPGVLLDAGTGGIGAILGPEPAAPVAIPGGTALTFTYTVTASSAGSVSLTATVTGQDGNSAAALTSGPVSTAAVLVQNPAVLVATSAAFPATVNTGQTFLVTLTVTNTGQAAATGVDAAAFTPAGSGTIGAVTGPTPAAPVTLGGGTAITFTWTVAASAAGAVQLTTTVAGVDANAGWAVTAGAVTTNAVVIQSPALLAGALAAFPAVRNSGQAFLVTLSLTNTGGATATGLSLAPFRVAGAGGASPTAGPTPPLPGTLAGGAAVELTWTFTGGPGLGWLDLSLTVSGTDANSLLAVSTGPLASGTVLIQSPAALAASAALSNTTVCTGDAFLLTLTVTNTGQAAATGVAPAALFVVGTGTAAMAGPAPASVATLAGGAAVTFTWTLTASSAGSLGLSTTVAGTDLNAGSAVASNPVASPVAGLNAPGALAARWSLPASVSTGQPFAVTLTVTNTGGSSLGGVFPAVSTGAGVSLVSGPLPAAPVALAPGAAQTFAWTYAGASSGQPAFTATVTGADLCALRTTAASATLSVQTAALLAARLTISPDPANVGSNLQIRLTITNTGQAAATGVDAGVFAGTGPGAAVPVGGPSPALPVTLAGGAAVTFTWTATATTPGACGFTTTVTGLDANSAAALVTGPVTGGVMLTTAAALSAQAALLPLTVSTGQAITVSFTVSNTAGGNDAVNLVPVLVNGSAAGLTPTGSPAPGPYTIPGGSGQTFVWTYNTTAAGSLAFSLTATAQDAFTLGPLFAAATATGLVEAPALLTAGLALSTTLVYVGDTMLLTVTAGNAGQAAATGVLPPVPGITGGGITVTAAPPAVPATIAGGASVTWTWTLAGASPATAWFTVTVAGADANSGAAVSVAAASALPLRVATLGLTAVRIQVSPAACGLDQIVTLVLSVSNTGTLAAPGVLPAAWWTGTGQLVAVSGPAPVSALLLPGQTASFTWTYRTLRGGTVQFQAGAAASTGAATGTVTSAPVTILEAGGSLADLVVYPDPFRPADAVGGTVKFRRMPPFTKVRVYTIAAEEIVELESGAIGLAEWDGRNRAGVRVTPGIYVWVAESKAGERRVGKLQLAP